MVEIRRPAESSRTLVSNQQGNHRNEEGQQNPSRLLKKHARMRKKRANECSGTNDRAANKRYLRSIPASHVQAQMLAASSRIHSDLGRKIVAELQGFILKALKRSSVDSALVEGLLSDGLLAALPVVLRSGLPQVSVQGAEIVGAAALWSYELNAKFASDEQVVKALVGMISDQEEESAMAACNAAMDLATTLIARKSLIEAGAIEQFCNLFCQVAHISCKGPLRSSNISEDDIYECYSRPRDKDAVFWMHMDEFLGVILDACVVLIFNDDNNHLKMMPKELANATLSCLKEFWVCLKDQHQKQIKKSDDQDGDKMPIILSGKSHLVSKMIFRLGMEQDVSDYLIYSVDAVKESIFGGANIFFEHFVQHHWEWSPMLVRRMSKQKCNSDIIASVIGTTAQLNIDDLLNRLLTGILSCPPVTSDDLDVVDFLSEIGGGLGHSASYGQDIRIIRSVSEERYDGLSKTINEQHFVIEFNNLTNSPQFVSLHDCKCAYEMGYTIAIRGMEFRSSKVAAIADALARIFGQASVGANIYLTPHNSQGLAAHYDDHCVLVCQLAGTKKWTIYPPEELLPRLYEPLRVVQNVQDNGTDHKGIVLTEGDILYIPRGFPHSAHTFDFSSYDNNQMIKQGYRFDICSYGSGAELTASVKCNDTIKQTYGPNHSLACQAESANQNDYPILSEHTGFTASQSYEVEPASDAYSLHLTFGIEVEPPFEWEGFMHIALHCWAQNQKKENFPSGSSSQKMLNNIVGLLHVAIRSIGDSCNLFRKACTIATSPFECYYRRNMDWKGECGLGIYGETLSHEHLQKGLASEKMFAMLIETVSRRCSFTDAYRIVQSAISNSDCDSLQWMRWLRHLSYEDVNPNNELSWSDPLGMFREVLQPNEPNVEQYEKSFLKVKSNFCIEVKFEEACRGFEFLLNKYRYARKQFINGMLALHSISMKEI